MRFIFVLIPILAFFFLKDGATIRDEFVAAFGGGAPAAVVETFSRISIALLGEYIRALVLLSAASFTAHSLFLGFTGAPYAVLLAQWPGSANSYPWLGRLAAGLIVLLVTSLSGYNHVWLYVIFWLLYRLVQDYILSPYLMSKGVQLNPMLVLFGVLAGDQIAGVLGIFLSVPLLAILRVLFVRLRRTRTLDLVAPRGEL